MSSEEYKDITARLRRIEVLLKHDTREEWLPESDVMKMTGLGRRQLLRKRSAGILNWSTESGRKIKYLRKDVTDLLNKNSSLCMPE